MEIQWKKGLLTGTQYDFAQIFLSLKYVGSVTVGRDSSTIYIQIIAVCDFPVSRTHLQKSGEPFKMYGQPVVEMWALKPKELLHKERIQPLSLFLAVTTATLTSAWMKEQQ